MSPAELARLETEHALALLRELKKSKSSERDLAIARGALKQQWTAGWTAGIESKPKKKPRTDATAALRTNARVTPVDILREHLEARDPVSKSWAQLIAPALCHMQRRLEIPLEDVLDWIYSHEPVDVFEFNAWARERGATQARRAIA